MPELGRDPIELLTNKHLVKERWLSDKIMPMVAGGLGFAMVCYQNFAIRRPIFSGLQRHIGYATVGTVIGVFLEKYRREYYAERDAVLRHYIELHPDDFPRPVRQKYKEIMEPWIPIR